MHAVAMANMEFARILLLMTTNNGLVACAFSVNMVHDNNVLQQCVSEWSKLL